MSLEEKVNDKQSKGFMKKALKLGWNLGVAAATTALSTATVGMTGVIVGGMLGAGVAIGSIVKKKPLHEIVNNGLKAYSAINAVIYPIIELGNATFPLIDNSTLLGKAARTLYATTLYNAAFVGAFRGAEHLIDNYMNPTGITKTISNNFYNAWKRIGLGFLPGYALIANDVHSIFGLSPFAWNALPFGIYNAAKPLPAPKKSSGYSLNPMPAYAH